MVTRRGPDGQEGEGGGRQARPPASTVRTRIFRADSRARAQLLSLAVAGSWGSHRLSDLRLPRS